jgi:predicted PurR-regulated permease PerM
MDSQSKNSLMRLLQVALVGVILLIVWPFLMPIALAFVFAALLWPLAQMEWRFGKSKVWRAFLLTIGFMSLIIVPVVTLIVSGVFVLQKKIQEGALNQYDLQPGHWMRDILSTDLVEKVKTALNVSDEQLRQSLLSILQKTQFVVLEFLQGILSGAPAAAMSFVIMVLCLFWILKDQNQIEAWMNKHSPMKRKETAHLFETFRSASVSVVMAGILSGAAQAFIIGIGAAVSGLGNPWVAAMIVFFASFFPFLGSGLVSLSLMVIGVATQNIQGVLLFLPFAGISSVADNVIYPMVVGGRGEINPLISFLAVIGGIQLFGIFGIFLGPVILILCLRTLSLLSGDGIPEDAPPETPLPWRERLKNLMPLWLRNRIYR